MNFIITNPLGFLALLGIPVVLFIHFLQRRPKIVPISTLFLLERSQPESTKGKNFEKIISSIPLWLQLLLVLLLTWLLVQPRFSNVQSTQRIAVVLDSSASMRAFKAETREALVERISELQGYATNLELWLFESDPTAPRIFYGSDIDSALKKFDAWSPEAGATDPRRALQSARSLAGPKGALLYVTDTPVKQPPYNANVVSTGKQIPNCGFTGVDFEERDGQLIWKAIIRNYSASEQSRSWFLSSGDGKATEKRQITLAPNSMVPVQGLFPTDAKHCTLHLSEDEFDYDNHLPLVKPQPKKLFLHPLSSDYRDLAGKMSRSLPNTVLENVQEKADLHLGNYSQLDSLPGNHAIAFVNAEAGNKPYLTGHIVTEKHPLVDGLTWQSLLVKDTPGITPTEQDEVLIWQGKRALLLLRTTVPDAGEGEKKECRSLIFNFDIKQSNLMKQDSLAVLLLRFCENLRSEKIAPESSMLETSQEVFYSSPEDSTVTVTSQDILNGEQSQAAHSHSTPLFAPRHPGFLQVTASREGNTEMLLDAAVYFADTREADFSKCSPSYTPASVLAMTTEEQTDEDRHWRYWCLLGVLALLFSWHFSTPNISRNN